MQENKKRKQKNAAQLCRQPAVGKAGQFFQQSPALPTATALLFVDSLPRGLTAKNLHQLVCRRSAKTSPTVLDSAVGEGLTTPSSFADWDGAVG
jgi:hypothetical protein